MKTTLIRKLSSLCIVITVVATSWAAYAGEGCTKGENKGCQVKEKQCDAEKKEACKEQGSCGENKSCCAKKGAKASPSK